MLTQKGNLHKKKFKKYCTLAKSFFYKELNNNFSFFRSSIKSFEINSKVLLHIITFYVEK